MTTKNIKTILFAGLLAAMILPFSNMGVAEAVNENANDRVLDKFAKDKAKYQRDLEDNKKSASEKAELRADIKRIDLMEKILKAEEKGNEEKVTVLIEKLQATYSADQKHEANVKKNANTLSQLSSLDTFSNQETTVGTLSFDEYPITQVSGSVSGWSTVVTKFNCDIQSTSWGYNSGVTVSDSQGLLVAFSYDYPSDFGPSGYPCNDKPHYKSTFSMYTYGNGHNAAWCYVTIAEDYGTTTGLSCNNKSGQGGLVTTDALYGTSNSNTSEFQGVTGIIL